MWGRVGVITPSITGLMPVAMPHSAGTIYCDIDRILRYRLSIIYYTVVVQSFTLYLFGLNSNIRLYQSRHSDIMKNNPNHTL